MDDIPGQILTGLTSVLPVWLRHETEMSDAHARTYRPDRHHARLAVNAANTLVDFLLKSYTLRQRKDAKDLAIKVTDHLSV